MKRCLPLLPLLALAPLGDFLGAYLEGWGFSVGLFIGGASMFILPWIVSAVLGLACSNSCGGRTLAFAGSFVLQFVLLFTVVPPGAESEMIGIAHRLKREFSAGELRACADQLRAKYRAGDLVGKKGIVSIAEVSVENDPLIVDDLELPASLRGQFRAVVVQKVKTTGDIEVWFSLGNGRGIVCNGNKYESGFFTYSIADGVHAYRHMRM
jgi:hypothetical protein